MVMHPRGARKANINDIPRKVNDLITEYTSI